MFNFLMVDIKNTNKIKTLIFLNLFYVWFIGKNIPITSTGYYNQIFTTFITLEWHFF